MERSCNGVYFRNNSLLRLKGTKGRADCLSYPECVCRWWKEEQWKELQKAGDGARMEKKKKKSGKAAALKCSVIWG